MPIVKRNVQKMSVMRKLAKAKNYIVITDNEAAINIRGLHPSKLLDAWEISTQRAQLEMFKDKLVAVIKEHDKYTAPKKVKKINVKKG